MTTRDEASPPTEPASTEVVRRPYRKPELRRLGSVREVTWGTAGSNLDNGFKGNPKVKM